MAKYVLTDLCGVGEGEEPHIKVFKNKDDLIEQLLGYLGDDISYEVKR